MCRYCRHKDVSQHIDAVRHKFDLDDVFAGDMKACLLAVSDRIRQVKRDRSAAARNSSETYLLDAELSALRFGAWVLNRSRDQERRGEKPWLNGYRDSMHGSKYCALFIA